MWYKDCWEYRISLPQHNYHFVGGQVRPLRNQFTYVVFGSTRDKIQGKSGKVESFEEAKNKVEEIWGNYNVQH